MTTDTMTGAAGAPPVAHGGEGLADSPTGLLGRLKSRVPEPALLMLEAVTRSYAQVVFARQAGIGLLLLAATMVVPAVGVVGLAGVILASALSLLMGLDKEAVRSGVLGYNALLVFLGLGAMLDRSPTFWVMAAVAAMLVVWLHAGLAGALAHHFRLPVLSLPFIAVVWLVAAAVPHVRGVAFTGHPPALELGALPGPAWFDLFLRSLGAIFFQPWWPAGLLVLAGLVWFSRIAAVHALIGFGVALAADAYLFHFPAELLPLYVGFNFMLTAVAVGGIYYVPGRASLLLAAGASLTSGLVAVGLLTWLAPVGMPILAVPMNLVVLAVLYALGQRLAPTAPKPAALVGVAPEENLTYDRTRVRRFQSSVPIRLALPFHGTWICTQGNDGAHTHQGPWRHGLDFEVADAEGQRYRHAGEALTDWRCYRLPVCAMAAGTVVKVVDGVPDNPIGAVDTARNWGNLVIVQHAPAVFSMVAHLSPGTLRVREGQAVVVGQVLGLCGNSGRSPVPHLHVQLQATPGVGQPTIPIAFHGVVVTDQDAPEVAIEHLPGEGERLANPVIDAGTAAAFAWIPGDRFRLEATDGARAWTEEAVVELDLLGNRSLHVEATGARLWFENRGVAFIAYDYVGPRDGALFAVYGGLSKVPLTTLPGLGWRDFLNPRRLARNPLAWLMDAAHAFVSMGDQQVSSRAAQRGTQVVITAEAPARRRWHRTLRAESIIEPGVGIRRITATTGAGEHARTLTVQWAAAEGGV